MSLCNPMPVISALVLSIVLVGCDDNGNAEPTAQAPSPIASFDKDRLWTLFSFASDHLDARRQDSLGPVALGRTKYLNCGLSFNASDDPRYKDMKEECDAWIKDLAGFLRINGLNEILPKHLEDRVFWVWLDSRLEAAKSCREQSQTLAETKLCDPLTSTIDQVGFNGNSIAETLGINIPETLRTK